MWLREAGPSWAELTLRTDTGSTESSTKRRLWRGPVAVRGRRLLPFRTLPDTTRRHTEAQLHLLLHPAGHTYPPGPSSMRGSQWSLHGRHFPPQTDCKGQKDLKARRLMRPEGIRKDHSSCSVDGALERASLKAGKPTNKLLQQCRWERHKSRQ